MQKPLEELGRAQLLGIVQGLIQTSENFGYVLGNRFWLRQYTCAFISQGHDAPVALQKAHETVGLIQAHESMVAIEAEERRRKRIAEAQAAEEAAAKAAEEKEAADAAAEIQEAPAVPVEEAPAANA